MARLLAIRCPKCNAGLKLPENRSSGKPITCPKCQHTFAAPSSPSRDDIPTSESPTGTIALADTTTELPATPEPVLRRQRSAEEEPEGGGNPLQALMSKMGDNAILYLLGGALAIMLVIYFSLFLSGSNTNNDGAANFDGSRSTSTTGTSNNSSSNAASPTGPPSTTTASGTSGTTPRPPKQQNAGTKLDAQKLDLAWLPPEAELILSLRPSELWGSPALSGSFTDASWQSFAQLLADEFNLATTDFERVTVGITGWPAGAQESLSAGLFARMLPRADMIVTAHLKTPADASRFGLEKHGFSLTDHRDRRYYRSPESNAGGESVCVLFADKTRIVFGRESSLRAAIERNGQAPRRPELDFVDPGASFVLVGVPRALAQWVLPGAGTMEGAFSRFQQVLASQARGVSFGLSLKGTASIDLASDCRDSAAAGALQQAFEQLLAERRQRSVPWPTAVNAHLADLFDRLSGNLKLEARGSAIHARGALPKLPEATLAELTSWISPLDESSADTTAEIDFADLPAGSPRTPVTMLGVPGGMQMQAHVRWGVAQATQRESRPALRLELVLDLKGGPAAGGMARSSCPVGGINADRGDKLNWRDECSDKAGGSEMVRIARNGSSGQTPDGVRIVLAADRPTQLPGTITQFEGSLTLISGREVKLVSIRNLRDYVGKSLPHPELKGSGLTFKVEREGNRLIVKAKGRDTRTAGPGPAIDGRGQPLPDVNVQFTDSNSELQFILPAGDDLPRDAGLQIAVCNSVKEHVIPFRFERLEVPAPPKRKSAPPATGNAGSSNVSVRPAPSQSGSGAVTVIEPAALMQAFIDDAPASKKRFLLQRLELTGVVTEVKQKGNVREIFLQIPQTGKSVSCDGFRDATMIDGKIMPGHTVTIRGSFLGVGNSDFVTLAQCELVGK